MHVQSLMQITGPITELTVLHVILGWMGVIGAFLTVVWAIHYDNKRATRWFAFLGLTVTFWALTTVFQIILTDSAQTVLLYLRLLFRMSVPFICFMFVSTYTGYRDSFTETVWLLFAASLVSVHVATFTNPLYGFTFTAEMYRQTPFVIAVLNKHIFGLYQTVVGYIWVIVSVGVLVYDFLTTDYLEDWRSGLLIAIVSTVVIADMIRYLPTSTVLVPGVDYAALALGALMPLFILALYRHNVLDITPVARDLVVESTNDAVVVVNNTHKIVDYNNAATQFFPDDIEEPIAMPIEDVLPAEITTRSIVRNLRDGRADVTLTVDGSERHYDLNVSSITTATMDDGAVLILRDITELKRKTKELERQNERLDQFAGTVAHDLRNPLAVIQTYAEDLMKDIDDDRIETIQESSIQMDAMIDDILALARQGTTIDTDALRDYELADVAEDAWRYAETDGGTLIVEGTDTFEMDHSRVQNLFSNLFRNAVEHSDGSPTVWVGLLSDDYGFYVEDDGPGIPEDDRERVFEHGVTTTDEGTGFGLTIVDAIADAHGWEIVLCEGRDGGARFEFYVR